MCGIAGVVAFDGSGLPAAGTAATMRDRLLHRGPDGRGEFEGAGVALAACRLAIVDLAPRGLMPMASADGRLVIVHNGEIYNRRDLRRTLAASGAVFRTTTDTEVLLHLYAAEGPAMLDRLDGMFAFAIWDAARRELFAARDRCGEKPFFYARHAGRLYFASEPKALFAAGVPCAFDETAWPELLTFRMVAGERTAYRGVTRLRPGHWLRAGATGLETQRWWRFTPSPLPSDPRLLGPLLEASVARRLVADVPVGTLLSGGLDSSAVTALAAALRPGLPAFTVGYDDGRTDERRFARAVAKATGVELHEIEVPAADVPTLLAEAAWHADEPIAFVAAPDLLAVSRHAGRHVRVLLTGEGADELFGGYDRFRLYRHPRTVRWGGLVLAPFAPRLRPRTRAQRLVAASRLGAAEWIVRANADRDPGAVTGAPLADWAPFRAALAARTVADHREPIQRALAYERETHLPGVLNHCDRQMMAAAVEARLPFLDPAILALAAGARTRDLFRGPHGKHPLRVAMAGRLPAEILARRKQGWVSPYWNQLRTLPPLRAWLARASDHAICATLPGGRAAAQEPIARFLAGELASAQLAWMIGRVVLWHEICVEGIRDPFGRCAT